MEMTDSDLTAMDFDHGTIENTQFINCCFDSSDITYSKVTNSVFKGFHYEEVSDLLFSNNEGDNVVIEIESVSLEELNKRLK
jgi:hypothetical protein